MRFAEGVRCLPFSRDAFDLGEDDFGLTMVLDQDLGEIAAFIHACLPQLARYGVAPRPEPGGNGRLGEVRRFESPQLSEVPAYVLATTTVESEVVQLAGILLKVVELVVLIIEVAVDVVQLRRCPG